MSARATVHIAGAPATSERDGVQRVLTACGRYVPAEQIASEPSQRTCWAVSCRRAARHAEQRSKAA